MFLTGEDIHADTAFSLENAVCAPNIDSEVDAVQGAVIADMPRVVSVPADGTRFFITAMSLIVI